MSAVGRLQLAFLRWWSAPWGDDPVVLEAAHRRRLRQELFVRGSVALLMFAFNELEHGFPLIRVVALAALALNVPYYLAARTKRLARPQAHMRLVIDVLLTTLGLYGAGGLLAAPFISVYMVIPIYAAFTLSGGACVLAAALATASFLLTAVLQQAYDPSAAAIPTTAWPIAIFNLLLLNVVAGLTALLAAAYRESQRRRIESEECFRSIANAATDAILVTDREGSVIVSNPAAQTMFGYSHADMRHTPLGRLMSPGPGRGRGGVGIASILTEGVHPLELAGVRQDGSEFPVELRVAPWTTRRATFFTCIVRDVTHRKQIEELARENAEVLRAVVQSSPIAVWAHHFDGGLTIWNPAAERMFGWTASEVLGQYPPFVPEERLSESHAIFERALGGAELMDVEVRRRKKDGSDIDISLSSAPLRDALGQVTGIVTVALDVTERKHLEAQNRQLQKMDTLGSLAGGIAHDFNNLLSVITGRSHMLGRSLEPDNALRRHLDLINETAAQAATLTQQLLAFSRKQAFSLSVVKLTDIVEGLERILRRLIGEDIELFITHRPNVGWVKADRGQLEQVILNLVVNAREAMPSGGMVNIEIADAPADTVPPAPRADESTGPYARLTVSDTGVGMDEATRSRIFEPFFTTKEVGKGTGLGLSTVYGIVNQHGGWIRVDSAPNRGTTFEVYLPRAEEPVMAAPAKRALPTSRRGSETILLVEDDAQVRSLAREILEENGYTVLEAALPTKALQIASKTHVELVLTDVIMPQMRGPALAERLNRLQPHTKTLLMSGYPDDPITKDVARSFTVLKKPLTPDGLLQGVRTALDQGGRRRKRRRRGSVLRDSNLHTNP